MMWLVAVELIVLHMIDGREVQVNPKQVTQLLSRPKDDAPNHALPDAVKCVVRLTDGSYTSVAETCETVRKLMEGVKP
jgi:hypothetical protein